MLPPLANPFKKVLHPFRHTKTEPESPTAKAGGSWTRKRLRSFSGRSFEGKRAGEKGEAASQEDGNGELRVGSPGIGSGDGSEGRHEERFKVHHRYLPILSGIICPFSVLLEVPGLTERWYIRTLGFDVVETQANPAILDVGLAISMAFGLAANLALVLRFLERRPLETTWVAVICLIIHDLINIATVTIFGVARRFDDGFTYGDAYWMTVASTTASLACTATLVADLIMTKDFRKHGSGLSEKQRSLVIAVMCLLCYIGLGSLVFSFIIKPKISYIDSLYFTICTITSVGFGDIVPSTLASRIWVIFYATLGLVLLAFTIAIARETVIESFEASYRHRRDALAKRARERKEGKRLKLKERKERRERELADLLANGTLPISSVLPGMSGGRGGQAARTQRELAFNQETADGVNAGKAWCRRFARKMGWMKTYPREARGGNDLRRETTSSSMSTLGEDSYKTFRSEMAREQSREFSIKILVAFSLFLVFWIVGAMVFHFTEHWTFFEALYFCYIFFSTIGYGDFSPKSSAGRGFFVAWALLGIATMTLLLSVLTESWSSRYKSSIIESKVKRTLRRAGHKAHEPGSNQAARQLLALEGFDEEEDIDPKDLPGKLVATLKSFHEHARFFMHGRTGDTPPALRKLIDAADEFDDELEQLRVNGDLEETAAHGETRHFLFMVSYERTFDALLDAADQLAGVFKSHQTELESMRALNAQLRSAIEEAEQRAHDEVETEDSEEPERAKVASKPSLLPFVRRPPGGDGDDELEEELEEEIDSPIVVEEEGEPKDETAAPSPSPPIITLRPPSALEAYRRSSAMIDRMERSTPPPPINLARRNSTAALNTLASLDFADSSASTASLHRDSIVDEEPDGAGLVDSPVASPGLDCPAVPDATNGDRSETTRARTLSFVEPSGTRERSGSSASSVFRGPRKGSSGG